MTVLVLILGVSMSILSIYIFYLKKEIRSVANQLREYNDFKINKKIDINLLDKDVEALAESINRHIDISKEMKLEEVRNKGELKNMIANISHDLRTPLTSIIGYIQILNKDTRRDKEEKAYLNKIEKRAKDLKSMIDDFFKLSLIQSEEYKIELGKVNLSDILCDKIVDFYDEFRKKEVEPVIEVEDNIFCIGNKLEIERVIENILSNAIKNTTGEILVSLKRDSGYVKVTVENSKSDKIHIDATKVFDRFYKGSDSHRGKKGTGVGLAIVKEVIKKMNGDASAVVEEKSFKLICRFRSIL